MADLSEVVGSIVTLCGGVIYPGGTDAASIVGADVLIYPGWPDSATLEADLAKLNAGDSTGRIHVSVYPRPGEAPTTRYRANPHQLDQTPATISLTWDGAQTIAVTGTITPGDNFAVQIGPVVNTYQVTPSDSLESVLQVLSSWAPSAEISGMSVVYPATVRVAYVAVGGHGRQVAELRRTRREFQVSVWSNDPGARDALAKALDESMAATPFLYFSDGCAGRLLYVSSPYSDSRSQVQLYRRDLIYSVEYATTQIIATTQIVEQTVTPHIQSVNGIAVN